MASRIAGITVEIEGNTSKLQSALSDVNKTLKTCDSNIRDIERGLKLDPGNLTLWQQKQEAVNTALEAAREKLQTLKTAQSQYAEGTQEWSNLQTEIGLTEAAISNYESKANEAATMTAQLSGEVEGAGQSADEAAGQVDELGQETEEAGDEASDSSQGWTILRDVIADLAKRAVSMAIDAVKNLSSAVKDGIRDSAAYADEILTLSHQTHLSTDALQEMFYATDLMDVPVETVSKALTKLTNTMADAEGGSDTATEAFESLGISIKDDVTGELRPAQDVFYDVIDAMQGISNETDRDAKAFDLFGRSAKELNPLIDMGSQGFAELQQEARDAGAVLSDDMLGTLGAVDDGFVRMDQAVQIAQRNLAVALAPAISTVAETLSSMAADADWQEVFSGLASAVEGILPDLTQMAKSVLPAIMSVLSKVMPLIEATINSLDMDELLNEIIGLLDVLIPQLAQGTVDLLPALIDLATAIVPIITQTIQILQPLVNVLAPALAVIIQVISTALNIMTNTVQSAVMPAIQKVTTVTEGWRVKIQAAGEQVKTFRQFINDNWNLIWSSTVSMFTNMGSKISGTFNNVVSTAKTAFATLKDAITRPIDQARDAVQSAINKMKSAFNFSWSLPRLKLPHVSISGSFSLNPPRVPRFGISWYAKAMENGVIFNTPTMFGLDGNKRMVAGDAGAEALIGVRSLYDLVNKAVASASSGNTVFNIYGAQGQDPREIANEVENILVNRIARRGFAV